MTGLRSGSAAVEQALVTAVVLVFTFGIMDWSWFMFHELTSVIAAERGARLAAGALPDDDPAAVAEAEVLAWLDAYGLDPSEASVEVRYEERDYGDVLTVEVTMPFDALIGLVPAPAALRGEATTVYYGGVFDEI